MQPIRIACALATAICLSTALGPHSILAAGADRPFDWQLPPGFPQPNVPADNPMSTAKVQLGCRLFFDTRLSITGKYACASCHIPSAGFSDGRATAIGATGKVLRRNTMSLTNVAYNVTYTWASKKIATLEEQMSTPLFATHPVEMGLRPDGFGVLSVLAADLSYENDFRAAFPRQSDAVSMSNLIKAIAAYERTLISGRSPFDRYVFDDDHDALTPAARRGMALFFSERTHCSECHSGINFAGPIVVDRSTSITPRFANTGLYAMNDQGLSEETNSPTDMGKFRVPTLRNIALTAPYMHDGSLATLPQVLDHYERGGRAGSANAEIRPLTLNNNEREELIAFLHSLTDSEFVSPRQQDCRSR